MVVFYYWGELPSAGTPGVEISVQLTNCTLISDIFREDVAEGDRCLRVCSHRTSCVDPNSIRCFASYLELGLAQKNHGRQGEPSARGIDIGSSVQLTVHYVV